MYMLLFFLALLTAVGRVYGDALSPSSAAAGAPAIVVSKLTGEGALQDTTGANVRGCDLGIQFEHRGELWALFGDTFGNGSDFVSPHGARTAWRSQTLARVSVRSTSGDLSVAAVAWDRASETDTSARELMHADHDTSFKSELTVIPTAAWSDNVTTHVWYMSVKRFDGDVWTCNNASVGTATGMLDDRGFVKHDNSVFWPSNSNTLQFAVANIEMRSTRQPTKCVPDPNFIYLFGTPCGRLGAGRLLRVPKDSPLRSDAYEYFIKNNKWSTDSATAVPVLPAGVGELSVTWIPAVERWLALYSAAGYHPSGKACGIVARISTCIWDEWSDERLIMSNASELGSQDPGVVYGGFTHPKLLTEDGEVYFAVSFHTTYDVHIAKFNISTVFADLL